MPPNQVHPMDRMGPKTQLIEIIRRVCGHIQYDKTVLIKELGGK